VIKGEVTSGLSQGQKKILETRDESVSRSVREAQQKKKTVQFGKLNQDAKHQKTNTKK